MKTLGLSLFIYGMIAVVILIFWIVSFAVYIFQEPPIAPGDMGALLEASRSAIFWLIVTPLAMYSIAVYALSESGEKIKNPKWLINALHLSGWKTIFAIIAILPLSAIKLARVIWQSKWLKNSRAFSRDVMESFS
ncbi:MAG: hypothetical protein PHG95_04210 [Patescibacteria group bacterium]|nr:hypothetical protein [Patescibacteria group bacterium]